MYISDYVTVVNSYLFADYRQLYDTGITSLRLSPNLTEIGSYAFREGLSISTLTLPEPLQKIGQNAFFSNYSISEITIGSKLTSIGIGAFANMDALSVVYCYAKTPPSANGASYGEDISKARLRVPSESIDLYKSQTYSWALFGEILPLSNTNPMPDTPLIYTLVSHETGSISQNVKDGQILSFKIIPNDGWILHSLTENGVEITDKVDGNGIYTTNPLHEDTELYVVLKEGSNTATQKIQNDARAKVKVYSNCRD